MPDEIQLREWSARLMRFISYCNPYSVDKYYYWKDKFTTTNHGDACCPAICLVRDWTPDKPETGQIWLVVERMRELGFYINLVNGFTHCSVFFLRYKETQMSPSMGHFERAGESARDINPALAILKAAKATGVEVGE